MIYNSGSVKVRAGSSVVKGTSTDFSTYVSTGDLFRITGEAVFYDVAAIVDATELTLSSRYANTGYWTTRSENTASMGVSATTVGFTLSYTPVIQNYVVITASEERFTDDGAGVLTGNASPAGHGTVGYDDGAVSVTLGTDLNGSCNVTASFYSGGLLTTMPFSIVRDFTPNYNLPELGVNDTNFNYVVTKGMRLIDTALYNASVNSLICASSLTVGGNDVLSAASSLTDEALILGDGGAKGVKALALGAANLKLFMNAAGTAPEWAGGVNVVSATKDISIGAPTDQAITGFGFKPSMAIILAFVTNVVGNMSIGFVNPDGSEAGVYDYSVVTANKWVTAWGSAVLIRTGAEDYNSAVWKSWDADGLTLTWAKTGSPTGTATIVIAAWR